MTESTFPFAAGSEPSALDEAPASRRNVIVAGAVAGALALGAAGYLLLGGAGGPTGTVAAGVTPDFPSVAASPASTPAAKPVAKAPAPTAEPLGRNPFRALYVVPITAAADTGSTAAGSTGTDSTGAVPTAGGTGSTGTGSTGTTTIGSTGMDATNTGSPSPSPSATPVPYALKLVAISKPSPEARFYTFTVDGKSTTVIPAQRFGKHGELVVLAYTKNAAGTATGAILQVSHDNPIDVKIGERVSVK